MPFAEVNGIDLYYESHGREDAPAVVFLHGAAGNHISWWRQVPTFRRGYRCITIDHRGFGRSRDATGEGGARFVDDIAALLDHLGVERAALVCQSMGGRTGLGFAVRRPDRVWALVMADTWGFFDWPELRERVRQMRESGGADQRPLEERALAASYQEREPILTFLYRQVASVNPPRDTSALQQGGPTRDEVAALAVPVLFIVGSEDALTTPDVIREVHGIVRGSQYREFAGAGHSVYWEMPEAFNEAVGEFLASHSPSPTARASERVAESA